MAPPEQAVGPLPDPTATDTLLRPFRPELLVLRPFLFLVFESERPLSGGARFALWGADEIVIGRGPARRLTRKRADGKSQLAITLNSSVLSSAHARLRETPEGWTVEDLGSRNGTYVNGQQATRAVLNPGDVLALGRAFFSIEFHEVPDTWDAEPAMGDLDLETPNADDAGLVTLVPGLGSRLARLRAEAVRDSAITLVGETGTGKEVLARAIHRLSRRPGPYLAINCGSIPRELIQSELFGHVRGAFSGAAGNTGHVRDAHQGTLLLDEVIEAPPEVQVAFLRVLQEKVVVPVGSSRPVPVDVRVIAAAQRPLEDVVAGGAFRKDLQARLEGFVFVVPPLRERMEDLGLLVAHTLVALGATEQDAPRFTPEAAFRLLLHDWPMNVRELVSVLRRMWGNAERGLMSEKDVPVAKPRAGQTVSLKEQLIAHLQTTRGNVAETARRMGRARPLVHRWLKRFEIDPEKFRS